jgi:hypothetical protein
MGIKTGCLMEFILAAWIDPFAAAIKYRMLECLNLQFLGKMRSIVFL